jgi:hypothetical protein
MPEKYTTVLGANGFSTREFTLLQWVIEATVQQIDLRNFGIPKIHDPWTAEENITFLKKLAKAPLYARIRKAEDALKPLLDRK